MDNMSLKFVLIDLGYPMREKTIRNIINSLENIIYLNMAFSKNEINLNVTVLNGDFAIIYFDLNSEYKYQTVIENLNDLLYNAGDGRRVSVMDFKKFLKNSIEIVLCKLKKKNDDEVFSKKGYKVAIVSKKSAWIISDILTSLIKNLKIPIENYKIVQIINRKNDIKNTQIDYIFCDDEPNDLNMFFKNWLFNSKKELRIFMNENLEIKCEYEDCIINPQFQYNLSGTTQVCRLEIMNRISLNGLCPTMVFGIPKRVKGINTIDNVNLFKQLCIELYKMGEGLVAKSLNNISKYHILTSDGDIILMNDIVSNEFHLAKGEEFFNIINPSDEDASIVKDSLRNIELLYEYKPENFNSGIIELSRRRCYDQMEEKKISTDQSQPSVSKPPKKHEKKRSKDTHPALLSPEIINKYRKINKQAFNLPELGTEFTGFFDIN